MFWAFLLSYNSCNIKSSFKVYQVAFSIFTMMHCHDHNLILEHSQHWKETPGLLAVSPNSFPFSILFPVFIGLPILHILYKIESGHLWPLVAGFLVLRGLGRRSGGEKQWGLNSGTTPWAIPPTPFHVGYFQNRVSGTISPGWLRTS
jgi:hypothetical protein